MWWNLTALIWNFAQLHVMSCHLLICLFAICVSFWWSVHIYAHFFGWIVCFFHCWSLSTFCIFWICPLSHMCFASIFSHSVTYFLILLTMSFAEKKFSVLMKSKVSSLPFMDHSFRVISKCSNSYSKPPKFSPMLSSWSFIILCVLGLWWILS